MCNQIMPLRVLVLALAVLVAACQGGKASLENSRTEMMTVEGRKFEVRTASTGVPDEYRVLVVRATLVIDPDPDREYERNWVVARRAMDQTCKGRPYWVLDDMLIDKVNLQLRFRCQA